MHQAQPVAVPGFLGVTSCTGIIQVLVPVQTTAVVSCMYSAARGSVVLIARCPVWVGPQVCLVPIASQGFAHSQCRRGRDNLWMCLACAACLSPLCANVCADDAMMLLPQQLASHLYRNNVSYLYKYMLCSYRDPCTPKDTVQTSKYDSWCTCLPARP